MIQQVKKSITLLPGMVNPSDWGEIGLLQGVAMSGTQVVNPFYPVKMGSAGLTRTQIVQVNNSVQLLLSKLRTVIEGSE